MRLKRTRGALLLEALFGLGLFMTCLLFTFAIFPSSQKALGSSKNYAVAVNLARERMDIERSRAYDDPPIPAGATAINVTFQSGYNENVSALDQNDATRVTFQQFVVNASKTVLDEKTNDERKSIVVRVEWDEGPIKRNVQLETYDVK